MTNTKLPYGVGPDDALEAILTGKNTFITGGGGSGKSHLINTLRDFYAEDSLFLGPTGLSALNIKGMSCHKALGLTLGVTLPQDIPTVRSKKQAQLLSSKAINRIVIDEASMVRSDKFWEMDYKLRYFRKIDKPFGGLQVIALGDGFQISPVLTRQEEPLFREVHGSEIPFGSPSWVDCNFTNILLNKIHRQTDLEFVMHLNNLRMGNGIDLAIEYINDNCYAKGLHSEAVTLCSTNALAEEINKKMFNSLPGKSTKFTAVIRGEFKERPVLEEFELKIGTKVMIVSNCSAENPRYVNGSVGYVTKILRDGIEVDIDGELVEVLPKIWENVVYNFKPAVNPDGTPDLDAKGKQREVVTEEKIGSYVALPVKLGYAITTHKSQGLTLGKVNIDFGAAGAFTPGQAYVGLSRASTVDGLRMVRPLRRKDIKIDTRIVSFYNKTFPNMPMFKE